MFAECKHGLPLTVIECPACAAEAEGGVVKVEPVVHMKADLGDERFKRLFDEAQEKEGAS